MSPGLNLKRYSDKALATQTREYAFIQRATVTRDGRGGKTEEWANTTAAPHAMAIIPLSAKQKFDYKSINVEATHQIKVRGEIDVTEYDRVLYGTRIFEILTVEDIQERGIVKWLTCKERRS